MRSAFEKFVLALWYPDTRRPLPWLLRGICGLLLIPMSWSVSLLGRRARARTVRIVPSGLPVVVVVGNLVAGGAGKTPATLAIAAFLNEAGFKAGLLSNAYRASRPDARIIGESSTAAEVGDEALLLARASGLPVASGRARRDAFNLLCHQYPDLQVVISDDGLQHSALARNLELVVFDERGAGNRRLMPAGPLREPLRNALHMDAILLNGTRISPITHPRQFHFSIKARALISLQEFGKPRQLGKAQQLEKARQLGKPQTFAEAGSHASQGLRDTVRRLTETGGDRLLAIAGIAHPQRFADTLAGIGLNCPVRALGDHARLDGEALKAIDADVIVMTAKDAVKLLGVDDPRCWVLIVEAEFEERFFPWLLGKIEPLIESSNHG